jgi:hypothetical protein
LGGRGIKKYQRIKLLFEKGFYTVHLDKFPFVAFVINPAVPKELLERSSEIQAILVRRTTLNKKLFGFYGNFFGADV